MKKRKYKSPSVVPEQIGLRTTTKDKLQQNHYSKTSSVRRMRKQRVTTYMITLTQVTQLVVNAPLWIIF